MELNDEIEDLSSLSAEEKQKYLFLKQKKLLEIFLEKSLISKEQYSKSLGDLAKKRAVAATQG